jgi:serine/threonine protein kinase
MKKNINDIALPIGTILNNRYVIEQIYYWGYLNILYRCRDMTIEDEVMVKEFCPYALCYRDIDGKSITCKGNQYINDYRSAYQSFEYECNVVKVLNAKDIKNIVKYRDDFTENETKYYVTDMIDGFPLDDIVEKKTPFNKVKIMRSLIHTIKSIHLGDILHLDIKPSNIIINSKDEAVLIDFGNACNMNEKQKENIFVSKGFSAPEIYYKGKIGIETDIYSLGALLYYIMSSTVPPAADKRMEGEKILELSRMTTIAYPLEDCIMRALQLESGKRFKNLALFEKIIR